MKWSDYIKTQEYQDTVQPKIKVNTIEVVDTGGTVEGVIWTPDPGNVVFSNAVRDMSQTSGLLIDQGGPALVGSSAEIKSLAYGDFRVVGVDPNGELYGIEPAATWCEDDDSSVTRQIGDSWEAIGSGDDALEITTPQDIAAGDKISITISLELFNYLTSKVDIDIGYSIGGGAVNTSTSFEISPNFNGSKALQFNFDAANASTAGTIIELQIKMQSTGTNVWLRGDINGHYLHVCSEPVVKEI